MLEHEQNMAALNNHLQMTRLRQQKRLVYFNLGREEQEGYYLFLCTFGWGYTALGGQKLINFPGVYSQRHCNRQNCTLHLHLVLNVVTSAFFL